jgi:hypothetical protein
MVGSLTNCFGTAGYAMIYSMGQENGANEVKQLRQDLRRLEAPADKKELLDRSMRRVSHMGWGKISVSEYDPVDGIVNINVKANPFSDKCGAKEAYGCFFLHGYMAGLVSEVMEEEMEYGVPRCLDVEKGSCVLRLVQASSNTLHKLALQEAVP